MPRWLNKTPHARWTVQCLSPRDKQETTPFKLNDLLKVTDPGSVKRKLLQATESPLLFSCACEASPGSGSASQTGAAQREQDTLAERARASFHFQQGLPLSQLPRVLSDFIF